MFIPNNHGRNVGDRVRITSDVKVLRGTYTAGHRFTVVSRGPRGLDLVDDDGNKLLETGLIDSLIVPDNGR